MNLGASEQLRERLSTLLSDRGYASYPKVVRSELEDTYKVCVVLHPSEAKLEAKLKNIETLPWKPLSGEGGNQYVEKTPRTPSQNTDSFGFYPSTSRRRVDGPASSPDVNPAYSGLRRMPDLQDLVRRVAMRDDLKSRIAKVSKTLKSLQIAKTAVGDFRRESENLISDLLEQLNEDGHTGRHKIVRLTKRLRQALKDDGYAFREAASNV